MIFPALITTPHLCRGGSCRPGTMNCPEYRDRDIAMHLARWRLRKLELTGKVPAAGVEPTRDFRPFGF